LPAKNDLVEHGNLAAVLVYALVATLLLVVAGAVRLCAGKKLTRAQWDKISTRVEVGVFLGLVLLGVAVTFYDHFANR
jgi:heme/copper-type cytochrome/quinol oxidase subunit 3